MTKTISHELPDFIGIGAMRCGTTWITDQLRSHPEIYVPEHYKEIHFFDRYFDEGVDWYVANFSAKAAHQKAGEFTPYYLRDEQALKRMAQTCPDAKLIVSIRNPVERAFSHYIFLKNRHDITSSFYETLFDERFDLLRTGLYGSQIQTCLRYYPQEKIHVVLFEEIKAEPEKVMTALYEFLGVDSHYIPQTLAHKSNAKHGVKSMILARGLRKSKQLIRPFISGREQLMKLGFFKFGKFLNRLNATPVEKETMDQQSIEYLKQYYKNDFLLLKSMLGSRVSHWE
ncbi:MAG: sulfotransferase [Candidatus Marinimicrobia bacterium]|nr:sulfotransferase [Candidatus Neomarinimicrobiota bacterium]